MLQLFLLTALGAVPAFSQSAEKPAPIADPRCAAITCPVGARCEVQNLQCREPPCPAPRVQCVPGNPTNPCAVHLCPKPLVCKNVQVQCFVPPCYPIAQCVNATDSRTPSTPGNGAQCPVNEHFNSCGGCDNTCENKVVACPAICRLEGACRCDSGFYRNQEGKCVTEAQCASQNASQQCGLNEYFDSCGGCDNTCEQKQVFCAAVCRLPGKCRCKQGFYRNQAGQCVTEAQCDGQNTTQCGENEFFDQCSGCEATCQNKRPICTLICRMPGKCRCSQGFYRNQAGRCVPEAQCDAEISV